MELLEPNQCVQAYFKKLSLFKYGIIGHNMNCTFLL